MIWESQAPTRNTNKECFHVLIGYVLLYLIYYVSTLYSRIRMYVLMNQDAYIHVQVLHYIVYTNVTCML